MIVQGKNRSKGGAGDAPTLSTINKNKYLQTS